MNKGCVGDFVNTCCVCLREGNLYRVVYSKDVNTNTWLSMLKVCVGNIEWSAEYFICQSCSEDLDAVYRFHQLCIKSHETRLEAFSLTASRDSKKDYILPEEETDSNCSGEKMKKVSKDTPSVEEKGNVLSCGECCSSFTNDNELEEHSCKVHVLEDIAYGNDAFSVESDCVNDSDLYKPKNAQLKRVNYTCKQSFVCHLCNSTFNKCAKFIRHSIREHGINKSEVRPYACTECPKKYYNSTHLREHYLKSHENFRSEMCIYCSKTFSTRRALTIHEKIHENKRAYQCPFCPKRFNTVNSRLSHKVTVHADPSKWKYTCAICDKRFYSKSNMDTHLRRHNQDKPFSCHLCDKRFCDSTDLRLHIPSHTNIKEFKCNKCNREYKRERDLKMHMAKDHKVDNGIKVYVKKKKHICNLCPKAFCSKEKLIRHLCSHTGDKPFPCTVCDKRFTDKWYATQHMKTIHNLVQEHDQ